MFFYLGNMFPPNWGTYINILRILMLIYIKYYAGAGRGLIMLPHVQHVT